MSQAYFKKHSSLWHNRLDDAWDFTQFINKMGGTSSANDNDSDNDNDKKLIVPLQSVFLK